jgi:hypothetical protein
MADDAPSTATQTQTNSADQYDHAITLLDTTVAAPEQLGSLGDSVASPASASRRDSDASLRTRWNKTRLREELARRKYAKFQGGRYNGNECPIESSDTEESRRDSVEGKHGKRDYAMAQIGRLRDRIPFKAKKRPKARVGEEYEVDILYENQRGWFIFGIPLYSSKSLLNFDPSPWQTSAFKESPVDITNAQVPDPSWAWVWKNWYVDMSHDVDEEGWEYSFAFRHGFSWHGTHPFFRSFARRRRWLRKRVKIHPYTPEDGQGSMTEGHILNLDYFTIHPARRECSRESSLNRAMMHRFSLPSSFQPEGEDDKTDEDISSIRALMEALKNATVDRKKLEAIYSFLENGGEELHYLGESINEMLSLLIYPISRAQLLENLKRAYDDVDGGRSLRSDDRSKTDANMRRKSNLQSAIQAIESTSDQFNYSSNAKLISRDDQEVIQSEEGPEARDCQSRLLEVESINPVSNQDDDGHRNITDSEVKDIPLDKDVGEESEIAHSSSGSQEENEVPMASDRKGKERAKT